MPPQFLVLGRLLTCSALSVFCILAARAEWEQGELVNEFNEPVGTTVTSQWVPPIRFSQSYPKLEAALRYTCDAGLPVQILFSHSVSFPVLEAYKQHRLKLRLDGNVEDSWYSAGQDNTSIRIARRPRQIRRDWSTAQTSALSVPFLRGCVAFRWDMRGFEEAVQQACD